MRTLRLVRLPALAGGLVFALGSFVTGQMHHENVVRSAIWLPAMLLCLERATWHPPRSTVTWSALGALAFSQAARSARAARIDGGDGARRLRDLSALVRRPGWVWPLLSSAVAIGGGLCLAAVQWIPLGEWALVSSRRAGVDYTFASAFALDPANLLSLLFPFFYRLPDATTWWTLWQQWEIELYVGIPTLALVIIGLGLGAPNRCGLLRGSRPGVTVDRHGRIRAVVQHAPALWALPGFSFLRAPARFSYLVVFACAALASFGLEALHDRRARVALSGAVAALLTLIVVAVVCLNLRAWLLADPARALDRVQAT